MKRPWKKQLDGKYNKTTKKKKNTNKQNRKTQMNLGRICRRQENN